MSKLYPQKVLALGTHYVSARPLLCAVTMFPPKTHVYDTTLGAYNFGARAQNFKKIAI